MFKRLGQCVQCHPGKVLAAWLAAALGLTFAAPAWQERSQDDDLRCLPARCSSTTGYRLMQEAFPQEVSGSKVIFAFERLHGPLSPTDLLLMDRCVTALEASRRQDAELRFGAITSYRDPLIGHRLLSKDKHCALVMVSLETPFLAFKTADCVRALERVLEPLVAEHQQSTEVDGQGLRMVTTGTSGMGRDLNEAAFRSIDLTTLATLILVVVILLAVYRAPFLALVPLATIAVSVWISMRLLTLLSLLLDIQLVHITQVFVIVVLYGAGTDYCLFLISRYREELQGGLAPDAAIASSLACVGWALMASAGTVICGLGMMGFAEFAKLRYTGPAIALSLAVAVLASLTLAPALLRLLGRHAFWPRDIAAVNRARPESAARVFVGRFWTRLSERIVAHPGRIWLGAVLILLPLAILGLCTRSTNDISAELPRFCQGRTGLEMIRTHFNPGEIGPLNVLLLADEDWRSERGRAFLARASAELTELGHVAEVRSLIQPLGPREAQPPQGTAAWIPKVAGTLVDHLAGKRYVAGLGGRHVTRMEVVFRTEPFAPQSHAAMANVKLRLERLVKESAAPGLAFALFGITTVSHDVTALQESDRTLVNSLVLVSIFFILAALVRRPGVAAYLLVSVLFSYYVAIGATELLSWGWLDSQLGAIDWKVPFFLFTILVAVGEDYNIFLMTRVMEEERQLGLRLGVQRALACTGGTISACGLIMAGTFATLMLGELPTLVQLGLALTIGVLLDTFVVRPVLVPAFLLMMDNARQAILERLHPPASIPGPHLHLPGLLESVELTEEQEAPGLVST